MLLTVSGVVLEAFANVARSAGADMENRQDERLHFRCYYLSGAAKPLQCSAPRASC